MLTIMKNEREIKAQSLTGLEEYLENANSFKWRCWQMRRADGGVEWWGLWSSGLGDCDEAQKKLREEKKDYRTRDL